MRLDLTGKPLWGTYYGGSGDDMVRDLIVKNGAIYLSGYTMSPSGISTSGAHQTIFGGGADAFIAKFDSIEYLETFKKEDSNTECMNVFPNPSNSITRVDLLSPIFGELLQVFDARGLKVFEKEATIQNELDVSYYAKGIYFIRYRDCVIKFLKE